MIENMNISGNPQLQPEQAMVQHDIAPHAPH